jgi:hypothetical protein
MPPRWGNAPLVVYHGTDTTALGVSGGLTIGGTVRFRVNISRCRPFTDFGQGFYVTTHLHQARQWANAKVIRTPAASSRALVLMFTLDRDWLASLEGLDFVRPIQDFWNLVYDCRNLWPPHQRAGGTRFSSKAAYDVVYGPVTLWPSILTIQDCDQISFHDQATLTGSAAANAGFDRDPVVIDMAPVDTFPP